MSSPGKVSEFIQLTPTEVADLPSILVQRLPRAAQLYNIVQLCLHNEQQNSFFRYTGLERDQTLYASRLITETKTYWSLLGPTSATDDKLAEIVIKFFPLVDWDRNISFNAVETTIFIHLSETCRRVQGYEATFYKGDNYTMSRDTALNMDLSLPEGSEMRRLRSDDMKAVFANWIHTADNEPAELDLVEYVALNLNSAALFIHGTLVSWGMNWWEGGIHIVHTIEEQRGRGYAKVLLRHLCWSAATRLGQFPVVHVADWNVSSQTLMKSVGFYHSHAHTWMEYTPIVTLKCV